MISLRYHLVSLIAVFLALGLGIAIGSTLIQWATVETLESRLNDQELLDGENDELRVRIATLENMDDRFEQEAEESLAADRLRGVPVLIVALEGVDADALDAVQRTILFAGAQLAAMVTVPRDAGREKIRALGEALAKANDLPKTLETSDSEVSTSSAGSATTISGLDPATTSTTPSAERETSEVPTSITITSLAVTGTSLALAGPIEQAQGETTRIDLDAVAEAGGFSVAEQPLIVELGAVFADHAGLRIVVIWDDDFTADPMLVDILLETLIDETDGSSRGPFAAAVVAEVVTTQANITPESKATQSFPRSVTTAEVDKAGPTSTGELPNADDDGDENDGAENDGDENDGAVEDFVSPVAAIRKDEERSISTVDNVQTSLGRLALILAIDDLGQRKTGHYGIEPDADLLMPR